MSIVQRQLRVLYAGGALGQSAAYAVVSAMFLRFMISMPGWSNAKYYAVLGAIISASKILEALIEFPSGWVTDGWSNRQKALLLRIASAVIGLSVAVLFSLRLVPNQASVVWVMLVLIAFTGAYACFSVVHASLLAGLSQNTTDRVILSSRVAMCSVLGTTVGLIGAPLFSQRFGFGTMGIFLGVVSTLLLVNSSMAVFGSIGETAVTSIRRPCLADAWTILRNNRAFLALTMARSLTGIATNIVIVALSLIPMRFHREVGFAGLLNGAMMGACMVSLILFQRLRQARRPGSLLAAALLIMSAGMVGMGFAVYLGGFGLLWLSLAALGTGLAGYFGLPNAVLADIAVNEGKAQHCVQGLFFGSHLLLVNLFKSSAGIITGGVLASQSSIDANPACAVLLWLAGAFVFAGACVMWGGIRRAWCHVGCKGEVP